MLSKAQNLHSRLSKTLTPARTLVMSRIRTPSSGSVPDGENVEYLRHCGGSEYLISEIFAKPHVDRLAKWFNINKRVILLIKRNLYL
jgi:hypothetical protein